MLYTTRELAQQVRENISEANDTRVSNSQILSALNRAYDEAWDMMGRLYPDPVINYYETNANADGVITLREDIFENRVILVEFYQQKSADGYRTKITQSDNLNDIGVLNNITGGTPMVYSIVGRDIQLAPAKSAQKYTIRIWYVEEMLPLKLDQGRIDVIDVANNFIVVDDLTNAEEDGKVSLDPTGARSKYLNIVDSSTGLYKATLQIESIDGNKITIKTNPTRSSVFNLPVLSAIPADITLDDVISSVYGSGVVYFKKPTTNFLIQFATVEIQRSLGVSNLSYEESKLRELRETLEGSWRRRPASKFKRSYGRVFRTRNYKSWSY